MTQMLHRGAVGSRALSLALSLLAALCVSSALRADDEPVVFGRDIRPLLSDRCFACHGPDRRGQENKLRLDSREEAVKKAIRPGDAGASELLRRVTSSDPNVAMPPPESKKPRLGADEVELVRRWIDQGAPYAKHWAWVAPSRPPVPQVGRADWPLNPIDSFIAAAHERLGYEPVAPADPRTLLRRLSLDITGLPPSPAEVDAFVADPSDAAYRAAVERVLSSPHYGERMAMYWLDLVRYADTCGYHGDQHREVAPYRDWVIEAFNDNMPFDRFTTEQLAGDLLDDPTLGQRIASGYNRLLQTTEEGGAQAKEYEAIYAADRVRNVSSVWLGATMGCAQCHDHKFDPFTMVDFYSLAAFFADIKEAAVGRQNANLELPTAEQAAEIARLERRLGEAERLFSARTDEELAALPIVATLPSIEELRVAQRAWESALRDDVAAGKGPKLPDPVRAALGVAPEAQSDEQREVLTRHFRETAALLEAARSEIGALRSALQAARASVRRTLVTETTTPRTVRVLPRGNWLDESGPTVQPAVPAAFASATGPASRADRLGLARWIVSRDNPLAARVLMNRLWHLCFGNAIVRTLEDVGHQGEWPTHPELLDWLAVEFLESGQDIKHVLRLMLTSRTYRLSSIASPELRRRDPANRWLARQSRFRIDAEFVRDSALAVSGLLVADVGGESVKPYQPRGYWAQLNFPKREWENGRGDELYRRGVYTYWCRTFLHPSMKAFDAPTREECTASRTRSNTPLQSLVLLNDPSFVEAARRFAERIAAHAAAEPVERVRFAFREALARAPSEEEAAVLAEVYEAQRRRYASDEAAARELLSAGASPPPADAGVVELAAWTAVARVIFNLHEFITRS